MTGLMLLFLCVLLQLFGLVLCGFVLFLVFCACIKFWQDWRVWLRLRKTFPLKTKADKQWLTGGNMEVSLVEAKFLAQCQIRASFSSYGLQFRPVFNWPSFSSSGDAWDGFIILPVLFLAAIRNCTVFMMFRPIEVPWSALNPVAEVKDRLVLEFGAERYRLELSSHDSTGIQQHLRH